MKIVVGQKVLNLEELFTISQYSKNLASPVEVVVDSQIFADLGKIAGKDAAPCTDYPKMDAVSKNDARAILAVKLVQILKLKSQVQQVVVTKIVQILNDDMFGEGDQVSFFEKLYAIFASEKVFPSDKEKYILNSLPSVQYAKSGLLAYQCREAQGYLNAILAFSMETSEFPIDFFNDYSLTLRGRTTQGVQLFKNQILAMVENSKKKSAKPEPTEVQTKMNIPKVFNLHGQLADKSLDYCTALQHEINSDEASIFANKKYKELIKLAKLQEDEICAQIAEQYTLDKVCMNLQNLSASRAQLIADSKLESENMFKAYQKELLAIYKINKVAEEALIAKYQEKQAKSEAAQTDDKKKAAAKKKGKDGPPVIGFGKGTRQLFEYLQHLEVECGKDDQVFEKKLDFFKNRELQSIIREITELQNETKDPKCAKGTRDMSPTKMAIREKAFTIIRSIFKKHGASEIDTPVFELKETLTSKYGEDSKLIYDLKDQGGELLALRYDLTVPFARYVAQRGLSSIKRFHIAKVYRRDTPQMNKGRFREFYQCDFDIAGSYGLMIPDADLLSVIIDILSSIGVGEFIVKLNHRKFLDAMINLAGCEKRKFKAICSSIDKLDKEPWSAVRDELINMKGLTNLMCDKLEKFVQYKGSPWEMLNRLKTDKVFEGHEQGMETIKEMELLFTYLESMKVLDKISFDFSLARGLDYYTGVIYEAVLTDTDRVGSISGGGRYDGLIGMFSGKNIPSVGGSIGIERIFNILEEKAKAEGVIRATETQILVTSMGKNLTPKRMEACADLWRAGIKAETLYVENPRTDKTFSYAFDNGIPLILIIGENEIKNGIYKVKALNENKEYEFKVEELVPKVLEILQNNQVLLSKDKQGEAAQTTSNQKGCFLVNSNGYSYWQA